MIRLQHDTDFLAYCVIMIGGYQRQRRATAEQAQGVHDVGGAESLLHDDGLKEVGVIMRHVIRAYAHPGDFPRGIAMNSLEAYG